MITVKSFVFNELETNSFVLYDETLKCIIVDPGCNTKDQCSQLQKFIANNSLKPLYIVNTHGHFDHIFGNSWAKTTFECALYIHRDELPFVEHADKYAGIFGFTIKRQPSPDGFLVPGELIHFGNTSMEILHVPGHSAGSICLYSQADSILICGDVMFKGS